MWLIVQGGQRLGGRPQILIISYTRFLWQPPYFLPAGRYGFPVIRWRSAGPSFRSEEDPMNQCILSFSPNLFTSDLPYCLPVPLTLTNRPSPLRVLEHMSLVRSTLYYLPSSSRVECVRCSISIDCSTVQPILVFFFMRKGRSNIYF